MIGGGKHPGPPVKREHTCRTCGWTKVLPKRVVICPDCESSHIIIKVVR